MAVYTLQFYLNTPLEFWLKSHVLSAACGIFDICVFVCVLIWLAALTSGHALLGAAAMWLVAVLLRPFYRSFHLVVDFMLPWISRCVFLRFRRQCLFFFAIVISSWQQQHLSLIFVLISSGIAHWRIGQMHQISYDYHKINFWRS